MPEVKTALGKRKITEFLLEIGTASSKSEARRLIAQGALEIDGKKVKSPDGFIEVKSGMRFRVGKKKFFEIK